MTDLGSTIFPTSLNNWHDVSNCQGVRGHWSRVEIYLLCTISSSPNGLLRHRVMHVQYVSLELCGMMDEQ